MIDEINSLSESINAILDNKQKEKYFESIVVLYSFIEDVMKWLVLMQIIWNKSEKRVMPAGQLEEIIKFCNRLNFDNLLQIGNSIGLLDYSFFKRLEKVRIERNTIIHQYWIYTHKNKIHILRKKLEKLAKICSDLIGKLNALVEETGADDSYGIFEVKRGRNFLV